MIELFICKTKESGWKDTIVADKPHNVFTVYQRLHMNNQQHTIFMHRYLTKKAAEKYVAEQIANAPIEVTNGGYHDL